MPRGYLYIGNEQVLAVQHEGEDINNEDILINENGIYTFSPGYTGLGTVVVNVPGGGSSTYKAMQVMENIKNSGQQEYEQPIINEVVPILEEILNGEESEESGDDSE